MVVKVVGYGRVISDCEDCPHSEVGMFTICNKTGDSFTNGGIPNTCPLPDYKEGDK